MTFPYATGQSFMTFVRAYLLENASNMYMVYGNKYDSHRLNGKQNVAISTLHLYIILQGTSCTKSQTS